MSEKSNELPDAMLKDNEACCSAQVAAHQRPQLLEIPQRLGAMIHVFVAMVENLKNVVEKMRNNIF